MKSVVTYSIHFLVLASALFLSACQQRPNRPSPDQTISNLGPGEHLSFDPAGGADYLDGGDDLFFDDGTRLEARDPSDLNGNQVRDLLEPIYFEFDRATLTASERNKAMAAADYLRNHPMERLLIEGHCDWRGTSEYNLGLGDRRATSVKDYLVSLGISGDRIQVLSKGDLEAFQGSSEQQMAKDRRAELIVLKN